MTFYRQRNFLNGPGKVCQALALTRAENGLDLTGDTLFVCDAAEDMGLPCPDYPPEQILVGPRIGVDYAEEDRDLPWRFRLKKE
jgi:DNA-3-methyladenine glycosylase